VTRKDPTMKTNICIIAVLTTSLTLAVALLGAA
jgi:hypothetical protein